MEVVKLIADIMKMLVDDEESVYVESTRLKDSTLIEVTVAKTDIGKIIGRLGRNADSIRNILMCIGAKQKQHYVLQIIDG